MITATKLTANLAIAVGVIGILGLGVATPSLAQDTRFYEPGGSNYVAPFQPGYTDEHAVQRPIYRAPDYNARARAPAPRNRGGAYINRGAPVDDPPGSAFQSYGNSHDDMGCPC